MGLTNKKEKQLRKMPIVETKVFKSRDGRFVVHKTSIVSIKPTAYYQKVVGTSTEDLIFEEDDGLQEVVL